MQQQQHEYNAERQASQRIDGMEQRYKTEYTPLPIDLQQYEQQRGYQQGYDGQRVPHEGAQGQQFYAPPPPLYADYMRLNQQGSDGKILAAFSYLACWLTGLIMVLFVRENRFIRFHAIQSLLFFGGVNILYILYFIIMRTMWHHLPFIVALTVLAFILTTIIAGIGWLVGIVGALGGRYVKLPFVGDIAERYAGTRSPR